MNEPRGGFYSLEVPSQEEIRYLPCCDRGGEVATLSFKVGHVYCYDCVKGLGKFIGKMKGVQSVTVRNNDSAIIEYDPSGLEVNEEQFKIIVKESIERLGFRIKEY